VVDVMEVDAAEVVWPGAGAAGRLRAHPGPTVRDRALAAGFDLVVPRSRMVREGSDLISRISPA
jgi:hypothetical protein